MIMLRSRVRGCWKGQKMDEERTEGGPTGAASELKRSNARWARGEGNARRERKISCRSSS